MTATEFIKRHKFNIVQATQGTNLFPSVAMAQAMLESGNGNSQLAEFNNLFGIKAGSDWKGNTVVLPTDEFLSGQTVKIDSTFRVYNSARQSINDRVDFLNTKYPEVVAAGSAEAQAIALGNSDYATDPNYGNKLLQIIEANDLKSLDNNKTTMKNIQLAIAFLTIIVAMFTIYKHFKAA